jgi:pyruvate dehydrogenase E2 component (dihydrolipoamide acetyltransferase)
MKFVAVDGRSLHHRITRGAGDAVVFVHGFGGSLETWQENFAALAAAGRTVAALDLPGHGESSADVGSGSLEELATAVLRYLDAVGLGRVHLVGHSMGAAICLVLADRVPQRVRSLTLIGPAGIGQKINADFIRGYIGARTRVEIEPLVRLLYADPRHVTEQMLQQAVEYKRREGVIEALTKIASSRYVGTPAGRQLRDVAGCVPTLAVWGADDAVIPPPAPGELAREGVELHVLPGRGHMVQVEAADEVNRLIGNFLQGIG